MRILGIDSSTDLLAVGLADDSAVLCEKTIPSSLQHASRIVGLIDLLLKEQALTHRDLTGIAVAIGPGSFTGLRIGLAVAKGMAVAQGIPLVGVSSFEVIAERLAVRYPDCVLAAPARRGEYYVCRMKPPVDIAADCLLVAEENLAAHIGTTAAGLVGRAPSGIWLTVPQPLPPELLTISGGELALLGAKRLAAGKRDDVASLEPLYIALSQAERRFGQK